MRINKGGYIYRSHETKNSQIDQEWLRKEKKRKAINEEG